MAGLAGLLDLPELNEEAAAIAVVLD